MRLIFAILLFVNSVAYSQDVLPSWNESTSKSAIVDFVTKVTTPQSKSFVEEADRIAVFDNDGTLWAEKPVYTQILFVLDRIHALAPLHPEWETTEPFASVLKGDAEGALAQGKEALLKLIYATQTGMTTQEFEKIVLDWIHSAKHPEKNRLFTNMVYQPMIEILGYLRAHGFQTYISSGGSLEFMRPWTEKTYGIPPQQVLGTTVDLKYAVKDQMPVLIQLPKIAMVNDGQGKPVGIQKHIGRRPLMAFGNSDGDFEMLEWTTSGAGPRFGLIIHHTDAEREWAYDRQSSVGKLDRALNAAPQKGWVVVDMKNDWNKIFQ